MLYSIYGTTLESHIPLPDLPFSQKSRPDFSFSLLSSREKTNPSKTWTHHYCHNHDDHPWFSLAVEGGGYFCRLHDLADFHISLDGQTIRCIPVSDDSLDLVRHQFQDLILPLVLSHWGNAVFHASAVETTGGAVAFMGETGKGKSTLAAGFALKGYPLITDDGLLLKEKEGRFYCRPSYPGIRLWPDAVRALVKGMKPSTFDNHNQVKKRVNLVQGLEQREEAVPLKKIYILSPPEEDGGSGKVKIERIPLQKAFMELMKHFFRLDITDRERLKREFVAIGNIVNAVPVALLSVPRDYSILPAAREMILKDLF